MSERIRNQVHALVDSLDASRLLAVRLYIEELTAQSQERKQRPRSPLEAPRRRTSDPRFRGKAPDSLR